MSTLSLLVLVLVSSGGVSPLYAQVPADPVLEGEVRRGSQTLAGAMVVLHQVTPAASGEVDSLRAGPDGRFRFQLPSVPASDARSEVYFASVRHDGILYFGPLLGEAVQLDSLYLIQVHDTASAPPGGADFPVGVRNIILEGNPDGSWTVTDLIQIRNEDDRTWIPLGDEPLWSYPLARGGEGFILGQGDLPEDAVRFFGTRMLITAPVPPGERLYVVRYVVGDPDTEFPLPGFTEDVQLLVREPAPPLEIEGLRADQPLELEPGSTYRVFSGDSLTDASISVSLNPQRRAPMEWIAVILALVLGLIAVVAMKRRSSSPTPAQVAPAPGGPGTEVARVELLAEIAQLDEAFEAGPQDAEHRAAWEARRGELKARLHGLG